MKARQADLKMRLFAGRLFLRFAPLCSVVAILLTANCASPTRTSVSMDIDLPLAAGDQIVLFPNQHRAASSATRDFARCLGAELVERGAAHSEIMDTTEFQDSMFPWFEFDQAPQTAEEIGKLLSRSMIRERIAALNVRYLVSMELTKEVEGFPGMFCGAGYGGVGCLGVAWEDSESKLSAIVWDLQRGQKAGDLAVSASGRSLALGVGVPIVFTAYTEQGACEAMADALAGFLNGQAETKNSDQ